ncbi:MAG: leucine-rich repeat protein [archaeon]|nr:leucine-rich repeat protein [archaeon]
MQSRTMTTENTSLSFYNHVWTLRNVLFMAVLAVVMLMVVVVPASDAETEGDWSYAVENGSAIITGYFGEGGDVTIPSELNGMPVTKIGDRVFQKSHIVSTVSVPSTVSVIGDSVFERSTVTSITFMGEGLTWIGTQAFYGCTGLTGISFPDTLHDIAPRAFKGCTSLVSVDMPMTIGKISSGTFSKCSSLESIVIPKGANVNSDKVFEGCTSLLRVSFPDDLIYASINSFPDHVFHDQQGAPITDLAGLVGMTFVGGSVDAMYPAVEYSAYFICDGVVVDTFVGVAGSEIVAPQAPAKEGFTFASWIGFSEGDRMPSMDVAFIADYRVNSYEVVFLVDGEVLVKAMQDYGSPIRAVSALYKDGMVFVGWDGYTEGMTVPAHDVVFDAVYVSNVCTVTLVLDDVEVLLEVPYGTSLVLPAFSPVKDGFTFIGWEGYTERMVITSNVSFKALFVEGELTFNVTICYNNGEVVDVPVNFGESLEEPKHVYRYYRDADHAHVWSPLTKIYHDTVVYAIVEDYGMAGDDVSWYLDLSTGEMTLSGTGETYDWTAKTTPWYAYRWDIVSLVVEEGVTYLGSFAFYKYYNLADVVLPDSLVSTGRYSVVTHVLDHLRVGAGLKDLGMRGLFGMTLMEGDIRIPVRDYAIFAKEFYGSDGVLYLESIHGSVNEVSWNIDYGTRTLVISGNGSAGDWGATTAPWYPFRGYFENVVVEEGVTEIGDYSFYKYVGIRSIVLADSVERIGVNSLRGCSSLIGLVFGDGLVSIGSNALTGYAFMTINGESIRPSVGNLAGHIFFGNDERSFLRIA